METIVLDGIGTILRCTRAEARQVWHNEPEKRGLIWLDEEVSHCMCYSTEELRKVIGIKKQQPGYMAVQQ